MSPIAPELLRAALAVFAQRPDVHPAELQEALGVGRRLADRLIATLLDRGDVLAGHRHAREKAPGAPVVVYRMAKSEAAP